MAWSVQTVPGDGLELNQADTLFILTGDNTRFALWKGGNDDVFVMGNNQTVVQEYAAPNIVYDLGQNLNLEFHPMNQTTLTVYGFYPASGAHVTLTNDQAATETPYRNGCIWGTKLSVIGTNTSIGGPNTAYFPYVTHVDIVAGTGT